MPDGITYKDVPIDQIENLLRAHFDGHGGSVVQQSLTEGLYIFCCTHGKRDNCCAKFGQSVLYEFARIAAQRTINLNLWECTHIGADRLAAVVVAFPHGYMYGRVRSENVGEIMYYLEKGYPYPPCYRGQLGLDAIEQTAQAFGHSYWFENAIDNAKVEVESVTRVSLEEAEASLNVSDKYSSRIFGQFLLRLTRKEFSTYMDCDGVEAHQLKKVNRWVVSRVMPTSGNKI
jgi:hypothetical protein